MTAATEDQDNWDHSGSRLRGAQEPEWRAGLVSLSAFFMLNAP